MSSSKDKERIDFIISDVTNNRKNTTFEAARYYTPVIIAGYDNRTGLLSNHILQTVSEKNIQWDFHLQEKNEV